MSHANNITMRNIRMECENFFNVGLEAGGGNVNAYKYKLSYFTFENLNITAKNSTVDTSVIENFKLKNVILNGKKLF